MTDTRLTEAVSWALIGVGVGLACSWWACAAVGLVGIAVVSWAGR